ncbi:hypothetical protein TIFTF001_028390 [Ficus carica]|uniref:Uncharacterized protein n=1 Tax=Ficus carica TaxID=3494 RepID=A0AA88DPT6_FICCA|nr:hypothetical protein TIFTF001_028390 [Ficus carica]
MSDLLDSENPILSRNADITGSSSFTTSTSSDSTGETTTSRERTLDHLSGLSDVSSPDNREGVAMLEEILRVGPSMRLDPRFINELNRAALVPPTPASGAIAREQDVPERAASEASTSGREDFESPDSTPPAGEPIQVLQRARGRAMRINDQRVIRQADLEMVDLAGDHPVYAPNFYTSAMTERYLVVLREEFQIPADVDLVAPVAGDLPSCLPPRYIALSVEYFQAGLRLPFHPFLRRTLTRLNVTPIQLNANAYRILVSCYILWAKNFDEEIPFRAFQNLYRMKSALSSWAYYYFQGYRGTFIIGCPDSDKQAKFLWFFAGGRWLRGRLARHELPRMERVPLTFRRRYVWTQAPHTTSSNLEKIDALREKADPERNQIRLVSSESLNKHRWLNPPDTPDRFPQAGVAKSGVTVASLAPKKGAP